MYTYAEEDNYVLLGVYLSVLLVGDKLLTNFDEFWRCAD